VRYINPDQIVAAGRSALKPRLLITMALTMVGAVVIYGLFSMGDVSRAGAIFLRFVGGIGCLLWTLFGLTALAHQVYRGMQDEVTPNTLEAFCFARSRIGSLLLLPAWAIGALLALMLAEMLVLAFARIPGLGLVWLSVVGVPLLLLNTVVAVGLLLALFNIAARVAISEADTASLKAILWRLMRQRLPELLIYNLGGVLITVFAAVLVLSPIWLGMQITWGLADYVAGTQMETVQAASGFWGGVAHLVGLAMFGSLLAVIASVPGVVITHMTLLVHKELDESEKEESAAATAAEKGYETEAEPEEKTPLKRRRRSTAAKTASKSRSSGSTKPRATRSRTKKSTEKGDKKDDVTASGDADTDAS